MKKEFLIVSVLITALLLSACNSNQSKATETPTLDPGFMATAVAETVQAMAMQQPTMTIPAPTAEPTATLPQAQPTDTVSALPQPTVAPAQACNAAEFVSETIPDNTKIQLNRAFTKSWTFMNTGTCTWNTDYKIMFVSGDEMGAPASVSLTESVPPGAQTTVSVPMQAPYLEGTYTGYWALQTDGGVIFFTNNSVKIEVVSDAFRVTGVTTDLKSREPTCPYDYYYTISITTSSAGTVKYLLSDSEGNPYSIKSLAFSSAGTKDVDVSWMNMDSGSYWVKVYVETPNNQTFGPFKFKITCKP